jgi:hypothetical protein
VEEGRMTSEDAKIHPQRSILTRALGVEEDVQVDEADIDVRPGDRVLLCSDGLSGMIGDADIEHLLRETAEPKEAARRLIEAANSAGGVDNITVVVLDIELDGGDSGAPAGGTSSAGTRNGAASVSAADPPPSGTTNAGEGARGPFPLLRVLVWIAAALLVLVLGIVGLRLYLDQQWFVGVSNERVAVFRGVPSEALGFRLSHVVVVTQLPADEVGALPFYGELAEGIPVADRGAAGEVIRQMDADLQASLSEGAGGGGGQANDQGGGDGAGGGQGGGGDGAGGNGGTGGAP